MEAITHGLNVLAWYENFIEAEIPPETIWDDAQGIEEWFKAVRLKKDAEMGRGAVDGDDGTDNTAVGNDLAGFFRE